MGNTARLMQHIPGTMGSTDDYEYDLVTLGAGSGGTRASRISAGVMVPELPAWSCHSASLPATKCGAGGT